MIETLPAPPHVVAVRISGETGDADSDTVYDALDAASRAHDLVALYVEIGWIHGVSPEQFVDDVRDGRVRMAGQEKVKRIAIVSDSYERRTVLRTESAEAEETLMAHVEVFPPAARVAAMEWATEGGTPRVYVA